MIRAFFSSQAFSAERRLLHNMEMFSRQDPLLKKDDTHESNVKGTTEAQEGKKKEAGEKKKLEQKAEQPPIQRMENMQKSFELALRKHSKEVADAQVRAQKAQEIAKEQNKNADLAIEAVNPTTVFMNTEGTKTREKIPTVTGVDASAAANQGTGQAAKQGELEQKQKKAAGAESPTRAAGDADGSNGRPA